MKRVTSIVMALCAVVFLVSGGILLSNNQQDASSQDAFEALSQRISTSALAEAPASTSDATATPEATEAPTVINPPIEALPETDDSVLLSYREMAKEQPDMVGWLKIEGTVIDYPVMRSADEAERYLHRDFEGNNSRAGTPFMLPISDPLIPNENIIIYAHHMKNGSMFGSLPVYETKDAYDKQPYIQFDTLVERGTYKIIAVFRTSIGAEDEFSYYRYEWLDDEETFNRYMRGVMANRLYDTSLLRFQPRPAMCLTQHLSSLKSPMLPRWR